MKKRYILSLFTLLFSPAAFADVDYVIYGGFAATVNAFLRLSAIFNNPDFEYYIYAAAGAGVIAGYFIVMGKGFIGQQGLKLGDALFCLFVTLFGVTIYVSAMKVTTTVHIYDQTNNDYEPVAGIPSLIAYAIQLPNVLERGMTDIVNVSTIYDRSQHANGKSMELILNALTSNPLAHDAYLNRSLYSYINTCMPPGLASNAYTFNLNEFMSTSTNLLAELEKLKSLSIPVIYYDSVNRGGVEMSCSAAFDTMSPILTASATYTEHTEKICEKSGFDPTDAAQLAQCRTRLVDISNLVFGAGVHSSDTKIYYDQAVAQATYDLLSNYAGTAISEIANYREISQGYGNIIVAEGWIPAIRSSTTVIILSITPILAIFIVTPMIFKSLHLLFTLFFFVGIWGVTDAIIHANIMDQIGELMNSIETYSGSLTAFMMAPGEINRGLAVFGKMQSLGVTLATLFSAIFFKLSARPFAMAGERLADAIESVGNRTGEEVMDPSSKANHIGSMGAAEAKLGYQRQVGHERYQQALAGQGTESLRAEVGYLDGLASKGNYTDPTQAFDMRGQAHGGNAAGNVLTTANNAAQTRNPISNYAADIASTESALHQSGIGIDQENIQRLAKGNNVSTPAATDQYAAINKADQIAKTTVSTNPDDFVTSSEVAEAKHMKDNFAYKDAVEANGKTVKAKAYDEASMKYRMGFGEHRANIDFQQSNGYTPEQHGERKTMTELEGTEAQQLGREFVVDQGMATAPLDAAFRMEAGQFGAFVAEHNNKEALAAFTGSSLGQIYANTSPDNHLNLSQQKANQLLDTITMPESQREALALLDPQLEAIRNGETDRITLPAGEQFNESFRTLTEAGFIPQQRHGDNTAYENMLDTGVVNNVTGGIEGAPLILEMSPEQAGNIQALNDPTMREFALQNQSALETIASSHNGGSLSTGFTYQSPNDSPTQTNTRAVVEQTTSVDNTHTEHGGIRTDQQTPWEIIENGTQAERERYYNEVVKSQARMNEVSHLMAQNNLGSLRQEEQNRYNENVGLNAQANVELSKKAAAEKLKDEPSTAIGGGNKSPDANPSGSDNKGGITNKAGEVVDALPLGAGIGGTAIGSLDWSESSQSEYSVDVMQNEILAAFEEYKASQDIDQLEQTLTDIRSMDKQIANEATSNYENDFVSEEKDPPWYEEFADYASDTIDKYLR